MAKIIKGIAGIVSLAIAVFIVLVIYGLFTALNAAPAATLASSAQSTTTRTAHALDSQDFLQLSSKDALQSALASTDLEDSVGDEGMEGSGNGEGAQTVSGRPTSTSPSASGNSSGGSAASSPASSTNSGNSNASTPPAASSPSAPAASPKTYHPAWTETVESGYWDTETIPATYGERSVYGSVCNDCGENISGSAASHLKATHHSGYHEGIAGTESYEITPATTKPVWVDTSYTIEHAEYWD